MRNPLDKPVLIDLFAGRGGWWTTFLELGWRVIAFDLVMADMEIPEGVEYILRDILTMTADDLHAYNPLFVICSSPCEQFSVHGLKCFHPNPKHPEMGIKLFNHSKAVLEELGVPFVMENVRSAENFVGRSINHFGPFYLWGSAVPAIFPRDAYKVSKGTKFGRDKDGSRKGRKLNYMYYRTSSGSKARALHTANVAKIPDIVSRAIAQAAQNLLITA